MIIIWIKYLINSKKECLKNPVFLEKKYEACEDCSKGILCDGL